MPPAKSSKAAGKSRGKSAASSKFNFDAAKMRMVILIGDDGFLMREYTRQIAQQLKKEFDEIEEFSYNGETATLADVLDELRSYGLIQRHKLVILDNADKFLKDKKDEDEESAGPSRSGYRQAMERYAESPVDHATLLMRAGGWHPGKLDTAVAKVGMVFKAAPPNEESAVAWVMKRCAKAHECEIMPDAAALLVSQVGVELGRLDVEIGKLAAYVGAGNPIERAIVGELVGLSREEQVWSIQSAIATGDPGRALAKLEEFRPIDSGTLVMIAWAIMDLMRNVHAAARLLAQGGNPFNVGRQLKLWGDKQTAVLAAARRVSAETAANLLDKAVRTDQNNKSGVGEPVRSIEVLTLEIADTIGRGRHV